jgi:hypothetical protein
MQNYFPLLPLDHLARKFELFWLCGFLKRFSKSFPIEADVEIFYPIVAPHTTWAPWIKYNWFCTTCISGSTRVNLGFYGIVVHEKKIYKWPYPIFALLWLSSLWRGLGLSWVNSHHARYVCTKFDWNWPCVSFQKIISNIQNLM